MLQLIKNFFSISAPQQYSRSYPPKTASEALLMAIRDLEATEKMHQYKVNMHTWHEPNDIFTGTGTEPVCEVCFAGSVMARTLNADERTHHDPCDFENGWDSILSALDSLRNGHALGGYLSWREGFPGMTQNTISSLDFEPVPYEEDTVLFKQQMRGFAKALKAVGC